MNEVYGKLNISSQVYAFIAETEAELTPIFADISAIEAVNQARVLHAFQQERIALHHFAPTSGYGYDDIGRDALERVFAHALYAEDALVRPHLVSGTHAIFTALSGLLESGDIMLSITGTPYDTLDNAIGTKQNKPSSLVSMGIKYEQIELNAADCIDINALVCKLTQEKCKVVYMQRSRGYAWRASLTINELARAVTAVREVSPNSIIVVDNCYGEFTQMLEPTSVGADIIIGSLIKNPGGGFAPTGGYIAGKAIYIEQIAARLTVPGMGREVGSYAGSYRPFYQGLFMAPHVTAEALKTAILFARVFEKLGMQTLPVSNSVRSDIVQVIRFNSAESLIAFCRSIQFASPVDSHLTLEPWDMPGYTSQVIMASGSFVQGSSIELSADAPIKTPYTAYVQGALSFAHGRIGVMSSLQALLSSGEVQLP